MDSKTLIKISKYLSLHLRHQPEKLGLTLEPGGWVAVDDLLVACSAHRFPITRAALEEVVAGNDKQRFAFDQTGKKIRASQGHSVAVDLQLEPATAARASFTTAPARSRWQAILKVRPAENAAPPRASLGGHRNRAHGSGRAMAARRCSSS